jgi:lactoylglutathione lyase
MLKMDHVGVVVKCMEESVSFYGKAFGWEECGGSEDERVHIVYMKADNQTIELLKYKQENVVRGMGIVDHIAFTVDNIETEIEKVKQLGAKMLFDMPKDLGDKRITFFEGPSGERLEFVEYIK